MNPRKLRLGLILAAAAMLLALVLPLSGEAGMSLSARPPELALTVGAVLLFVSAGWRGGSWAVAFGLMGVLCGVATTLALLRDPAICPRLAKWNLVRRFQHGALKRFERGPIQLQIEFTPLPCGVFSHLAHDFVGRVIDYFRITEFSLQTSQ